MNQRFFKKGDFVSIYTNTDDCFGLGYVLITDESHIILQTLTPSADIDGLTLYRLDDIVKIEHNTTYQNKIARKVAKKQATLTKYELPQSDLILWMFQESQKQNLVLQVELQLSGHCDVQGYVRSWDNEVCVIQQIDARGRSDGEALFLISDISSIRLCENHAK